METGQYTHIKIDDKINDGAVRIINEGGVCVSTAFDFIYRDHAIEIVRHLIQLFKIGIDDI